MCFALLPLAWVGDSYAQTSDRRGFLWEVRKGKQVAWLLGTIHVGRPEFYPLPASRLAQVQRADAIVLEADISDTSRSIAATQKYALYAEGTPGLETRLTPELRQRIEAVLARNQLDLAPMMRMKPWMLANVLALFEAAQAGYVPALSVEAYLLRVAKTDGKPILEFEGIEQQFELFEKAPWATQISFLEEALKAVESRSARRELNRIVQAWETGPRVARTPTRGNERAIVGRLALYRRHDFAGPPSADGAQDRNDDGQWQDVRVRSRCAALGWTARVSRVVTCARLYGH